MGLLDGARKFPGILGTVLGGAPDPRLSDQQNEQAKRQALLMAGLGILGSNDSGLKAIAQGAMQGQMTGMQSRQGMVNQAAQQQSQQRLRDAVQGGQIDRGALERLFVASIQSGDMEAAGKLSEVLKSMGGQQGQSLPVLQVREGVNPDTGKAEQYQYNPHTGEVKWLGIPPVAGPKAPVPGTPEFYADLERRAGIAAKFRPAPRTAAGSEGERKAAAFAGFIPDAKAFIDTIEKAPGRIEQALSDKGLREFNSDEQQQLQLSGAGMAEAWLRMTTGAAYTEREFDNAYALFVPRPGDRKPALDMKRKNREKLMKMLKTASGRLAPADDEGAPDTPDDPFGDLIPGGG